MANKRHGRALSGARTTLSDNTGRGHWEHGSSRDTKLTERYHRGQKIKPSLEPQPTKGSQDPRATPKRDAYQESVFPNRADRMSRVQGPVTPRNEQSPLGQGEALASDNAEMNQTPELSTQVLKQLSQKLFQ